MSTVRRPLSTSHLPPFQSWAGLLSQINLPPTDKNFLVPKHSVVPRALKIQNAHQVHDHIYKLYVLPSAMPFGRFCTGKRTKYSLTSRIATAKQSHPALHQLQIKHSQERISFPANRAHTTKPLVLN